MNDFFDYYSESSIKDYEYTRRIKQKMMDTVSSKDFELKSTDEIFDFLENKIIRTAFPCFLKRYVFIKSNVDADPHEFEKIPEKTYISIIENSFRTNLAPFSFEKTSTKPKAAIKGWLRNSTVKRNAVFILGFGLKMTPEDVEGFLKKAIKEEGFNFNDPYETIYWYCYRKGLPYKSAADLIDEYDKMQPKEDEKLYNEINSGFNAKNKEEELKGNITNNIQLTSEKILKRYLQVLKFKNIGSNGSAKAYEKFIELFEKCKEVALYLLNEDMAFDVDVREKQKLTIDDIKTVDIERILCAGTLYNGDNWNLISIKFSSFKDLFDSKRMSRQRLQAIIDKKQVVERYDLITLLFMIIAAREDICSKEKMKLFVDEANQILEDCNMQGLYVVNPYEAFLIMCLNTESPLENRTEVIERSYDNQVKS